MAAQGRKLAWLGIDPGANGGLAALHDNGWMERTAMPNNETDILHWIETRYTGYAVIEKVQGYIGNAHPGSSMFSFGVSYGGLRMALVCAGAVADDGFKAIAPSVWERHFRKPVKGEKREDRKRALKGIAEFLFPDYTISLATADACLLASYCKHLCGGLTTTEYRGKATTYAKS